MRIFVIRRQYWVSALCLCAAAAMFWVVSNPAAVGAAGAQRQLPIYSVQCAEGEKKVAISFDAAWADARLRCKTEDRDIPIPFIYLRWRYSIPAAKNGK